MVNTSKFKVFVIGRNHGVERLFYARGYDPADSIKKADVVVWTGGSDVSPELYNEPKHPLTCVYPARDKWEKAAFEVANDGKKLLVGICRGAQFLNVMNGGSLWQDVNNHAIRGEHPMTYIKGSAADGMTHERIVMVNSTHHQQMIPRLQAPAFIWGKAGESTRKIAGNRLNGGKGDYFKLIPSPGHSTDAEIVYYPKTRSLCFQPHPEYNSRSTQDVFWDCMERAA